jgi:hypothetical protein
VHARAAFDHKGYTMRAMLKLRSIAIRLAFIPIFSVAHAQVPPAQTPDGPVTYLGLTFPSEIGGVQRFNVRAYEPDNPGLGYSAAYRHGEATSTVYIYDDGVPSIPDKLDSAVLRDQLKKVKADVGRAIEGTSVKETVTFTILDTVRRARLICSAYVLIRETRARDSFVCLGVFNGKFFKVRTTMPQRADAQAEIRRFVGLWVARLWN